MKAADYSHADDCAYRLRALIRTMEERARGLRDEEIGHAHITGLADIALLCELAGDLCNTVHDMMQIQHHEAVAS